MRARPDRHRRIVRLRQRRALAVVTTALSVAGAALATVALGTPSAGAVTGFTAGDVAVYRVGDGSGTLASTATKVFLDEYSPSGTLVQSVPMPTAVSGSNKILTASGTAGSEGGLTLSADGRYLVATGYNAAPGAANPSAATSASVTRTIATVSASDAVDSSTSLSNVASANNVRSAASSDGTKFWIAGADASSGVQYAADGASTGTALVSSTYKNGRQAMIANGQLYLGADPTKAGLGIATVGTGLPTSGTNAVTNLAFASGSAPAQPYAYSFLTLGSGSAPDTLYVADNSAGAVIKYVLSGGTWTKAGSVAISGVTGVTANDSNGTVTLYATSSNSSGTIGILSTVTDSSGLGGTLSGAASTLATAPTNEAFRGVAFAPGTVIGSGGGTPTTPPTVTPAYTGLPAALNDPTNPTLAITVGDPNYTASQLTLTATSSNTGVAPQSGITLSGTGATRTLTVTPNAVGYSTITLTVRAPDTTTATTTVSYGVSAYQGDPSDRYFSGAGNLSTAIDVGGGYMVVGDDNNNVLRLYNESNSSEPVKTFDFTGQLPYGSTSVDTEAATRIGNTIYWTGSMTNTSSGNLAPARSTLFATSVSGSGASTTLTYAGAYTGLKGDFATWDHTNGHGLGADHFGLTASQAAGVGSHDAGAFDVEGIESVQGSSTAAYFAFRAPDQPTTNRHLALVVPVTNLPALTNGSATQATFGTPMTWDLGGLGVREIRKNADGQYLVIAGTSDSSNSSFVLYSWDGNPAHPPLSTGLSLPPLPSGQYQGSWETIVSVPDPLTSGSAVQLVEDNGDTAWYGDSATSKDTLPAPLQKDIGRVFTYSAPSAAGTTTAITSSTTEAKIGQQVTYTGTVTPAVAGTPTGTITFRDGGTIISGCSGLALDANLSATCAVTYPHAAQHQVTAGYDGDTTYGPSMSTVLTLTVDPYTLTITADDKSTTFGAPEPTYTYTVGGLMNGDQLSTPPTCGVSGAHQSVGSYPITCSGASAGADYTIVYRSGTLTVAQATPTVVVSADHMSAVTGQPVSFTAAVGASGVSSVPTGSVTFSVNGSIPSGCSGVNLSGGTASCSVPAGFAAGSYPVVVSYGGDGSFAAASSDGSFTEQVTPAGTAAVVTPSSATPTQYDQDTFTATVAATAPGSGAPTGTVAFSDGSGAIAACTAQPVGTGGTATCTVTVVAAGSYTVTAAYSGDANFGMSSGASTVQVGAGSPANLSISPSSASIASGAYQVFTVTATDAQGRALGDVTAAATFTIDPDGTCSANRCTAAAAGSHTVTATDGSATTTATLAVTAGATVAAPRDFVGVGDDLSQYGFDFLADGSPGVAGGYNSIGNLGRVQSFDAGGDADGRAVYGPPGSDGTSASYDPSVILDPGTAPVVRPQGSTAGIAALLADSSGAVQFVRSSRLPTAAEQSEAGAAGWGGLHVVRYATTDLRIAVAAGATDAPAGLSATELVKIYSGAWKTWGDVPGYTGPAPSSTISPLLPAAGTDARAAFDADLAAANGGHAVVYASSVQVVPADDYTQLERVTAPSDAIEPFSASMLGLLAGGYFAADPIHALTGTAPDGSGTYDGSHPLYVVLRDSDLYRTSPLPGASLNWARLLFVGSNSVLTRRTTAPQLMAAGLTPNYADLGDVSS